MGQTEKAQEGKTGQGLIRLLRADEIECRVSMVNAKGAALLLYKDARVDQRILDEAFGIFGWKRSHQCIDGNLYCTVEVLDRESGEWISKQDVGAAGYAEKEKSQASDSFKRACFNWGIGRELYTAPFIWVAADRAGVKEKEGRTYCTGRFSVRQIGYSSEREINELVIVDADGKPVYELKKKEAPGSGGRTEKAEKTEKAGRGGRAAQGAVSEEQMDALHAELERTGVGMEAVRSRYRIQEPEKMPEEVYKKIMSALSKTKSSGAA